MNYLVETKKEFTIQVINILSPLIYDGIKSIYDTAKDKAKSNEELIVFQQLLKTILEWDSDILRNETQRILTSSNCPELLKDLVNALIKSNIMILTNTPPEKKDTLKISFKIEFSNFIHKCYIESARNVYQDPYLFYHNHTICNLKDNKRDALRLIKESIEEAIRKMLPLKMILQEYLGSSFKESFTKPDFEKVITENERNYLNGIASAINTEGGRIEKFSLEKKFDEASNKPIDKANDKPNQNDKINEEHNKVLNKPKMVENDDVDSVSYYRRSNVEDSFSNNKTNINKPVKAVVLNNDKQYKDSYTINMTDNGTDIESIRKRIGERFRKNAPDFYKV